MKGLAFSLSVLFLSLFLVAIKGQEIFVYERKNNQNPVKFEKDGVIQYNLETQTARYISLAKAGQSNVSDREIEIENSNYGLSEDGNGLYTLMLLNEQQGYRQFISIPKDVLKGEKFSRHFSLHFERENLVHVDFSSLFKEKATTEVKINGPKEVPNPVLKKAAVIDVKTGKEKVEEKKSFFAKYWYVILAVVLIVLLVPGGE